MQRRRRCAAEPEAEVGARAGAGPRGDIDLDNEQSDVGADADADIDGKATVADTGVSKERTGAFGHSGIGGSVAFCDSKRGLAVAVTINHLLSSRVVAKRVIRCITEVLNFGGSYDDFS